MLDKILRFHKILFNKYKKYIKISFFLIFILFLIKIIDSNQLLKIIKEIDIKLYIKLIRLLRGGSKDLHMIYPRNILIDMIHKEYLWQSKKLFEKFDKNFLNLILD